MKTDYLIRFYSFFLCIAIATATMQSCGSKGSDPTPGTNPTGVIPETERVSGLLTSGTWKIKSVTVDGTDQTALFKNFTITFAATSYSASSGGPVWPGNNTWTFSGTDATSFVRGDALLVNITSVSSSALTLSLTWTKTTYTGGRVESIAGKHVFVFGK